jgi:uncharacterized small protein (DUF1192 family)
MTTIQERQQADQDDADRYLTPRSALTHDPTVLYLTAEIAKREDALGIYDDEITRLHALLDAKDATIERVSALAAQWEQEAPTCPCMTCLTNRHHAERIRAALKGSS